MRCQFDARYQGIIVYSLVVDYALASSNNPLAVIFRGEQERQILNERCHIPAGGEVNIYGGSK